MPSGQSSTSTTKVDAPLAVNAPLNQLFNSLFGGTGGAAAGATNTLMGIMGGSTLQNNIGQIYNTLAASGGAQYQTGIGQMKAAAGATGNRFSTDLSSQIASYTNQYNQNLSREALSGGLQETQQQAGVAGNLMGIFSQAANQYYSPGQTTKSETMQTGVGAWMDPILGLAGAALGGAGAAGGFSALFS